MNTPLVFDGHNDLLYRLHHERKALRPEQFLNGLSGGHLDLPRMKRGGFAGGFFAVYVPPEGGLDNLDELMSGSNYDVPLPPLMTARESLPTAIHMIADLHRIARASEGRFRIARTITEIETSLRERAIAAILHMEGAEAIDEDLDGLHAFHAAGLRSLGPVWSRPTIFGHGVPFRYPSTGDTGPGLTEAGLRLVKECNSLGIMLDVSHLNEQGFWDLARTSTKPIVATHSNAHAISPHARNLTDKQLAAIAESDGMVGLNFACCFLRPDGQRDTATPLEVMIRHLDHLVRHLGEDRVGLGSDFDGAEIPRGIGDVAGLPALIEAMRQHQFGEALIEKIAHRNWLRVLAKTWA